MKTTKATLRRVFNLGNYESLAIELTAEIEDGETVDAVLDSLKEQALAWKRKEAKR